MAPAPPADDRNEPVDSDDEAFSREEADELVQEIEKRRTLRSGSAAVVALVGFLFSVFQLLLAAQGFRFTADVPFVGAVELASLQLLQANAIHVGFALVLAFLVFPPSRGRGPVSRRLSRVVPAVSARLGTDSPVTRTARGLRRGVRWAVLDPAMDRVTPVDILLVVCSVLATAYHVTDFQEIQRMRVFGLEAGRPVQEVFTFLDPLAPLLGPLADTSYAFLLGIVGVLLVLEATRRTIGMPLVVIVAAFIVYARYGVLIPQDMPFLGILSIPALDWTSIVQNLWYNTENGVFGIPVTVSVQFIYIFILFGAFLEMSGAGQWFIDLAYSATGTRKGGPAKASILASGFMGTISGSSIANTVTTGAFTIPLMKRSGYRPEFAGAVEAAASSGGQILPPVMGAAAFLIVQYTATPFADVIVAAAIPAIVFFFGVWVMVHLEAARAGIGGLDPSELVDARSHLRHGWFYIAPIALLLYYLIIERLSVSRSAWFTVLAVGALITLVAAYGDETRLQLGGVLLAITGAEFLAHLLGGVGVVGLLTGESGAGVAANVAFATVLGNLGWYAIAAGLTVLALNPRMDSSLLELDPQVQEAADRTATALRRPSLADNRLYRVLSFGGKSMESGARTAVPVVIAVAAAGIIPGVISVTGLGPNLVSLIRALAAGSLFLMLTMTAISSIILGMGMPTTVTYIILVSLLGPAMVAFGIPILAAHLFILYFGVIADITPPVAVAAYAASGVAQSDPFDTGIQAFSLSLNKAIVPFAFVLAPGILLLRTGVEVAGSDRTYRVATLADLADPTYLVPEVLIPVAGVFVGVVALAATVIGFLYTAVGRAERAAFAVSSALLMAPGLLLDVAFDLLGFVGVTVSAETFVLDLTLRAIGLVVFLVLAIKNRREADVETAPAESAEPA